MTVNNPERPGERKDMPDQSFNHDDMVARTFMLTDYFSRATDYEVESSNDMVVTAGEDAGVLTLTPVGAGNAVVTVTPTNGGGDGRGDPQTITVSIEATPVPTITRHAVASQSHRVWWS